VICYLVTLRVLHFNCNKKIVVRLWEALAECRFSIKTLRFMSHNGVERNRFIHTMTYKLCTCCAMRYDWSCSSCSSNFGYRDSQKSARKNGYVCSCTTQAEKEFVKRKKLGKEIEMTLARAQSLPVKYSVVKMILVTSLECP